MDAGDAVVENCGNFHAMRHGEAPPVRLRANRVLAAVGGGSGLEREAVDAAVATAVANAGAGAGAGLDERHIG